MTIVPDTKDWTWVLDRPCPQCGYDAAQVRPADVAARLREEVPVWLEALDEPGAATRPAPDTWSVLEYACHLRDVCDLFARRLGWMLDEDDPLFPNWDQDATAEEADYAAQRPEAVADELAAGAGAIAAAFDDVTGPQWRRTGRRSDGARFTVSSFARYFLHDVVHHTWDVTGRRAD